MPSFLSIWADSSLYETIILPPTLCVFSAIGGKGRIPFYSCHPFLLVKVRESARGYGSAKWDSFSFGAMQGCSGNFTCAFALVFRCLHAQHTASHWPFACGHARLCLWRPLACFLFLRSVSSGIFGPINWDFPPIKGHLPVCLCRGTVCRILPPRGLVYLSFFPLTPCHHQSAVCSS